MPLVVIDYAHTPDALENALAALRAHVAGRLICVFGCGGDRDRGKRPLMGQAAEQGADLLVITDDNPRTEASSAIIEEIRAGIGRQDAVTIIANRAEAIARTIARAASDAIYDWDLPTSMLWWSDGFYEIFGYAPERAPVQDHVAADTFRAAQERVRADVKVFAHPPHVFELGFGVLLLEGEHGLEPLHELGGDVVDHLLQCLPEFRKCHLASHGDDIGYRRPCRQLPCSSALPSHA